MLQAAGEDCVADENFGTYQVGYAKAHGIFPKQKNSCDSIADTLFYKYLRLLGRTTQRCLLKKPKAIWYPCSYTFLFAGSFKSPLALINP